MSFETLQHVSSAMLGTGLASGWRRKAAVWLDEKEKPAAFLEFANQLTLPELLK
jgi:hypothetical protein